MLFSYSKTSFPYAVTPRHAHAHLPSGEPGSPSELDHQHTSCEKSGQNQKEGETEVQSRQDEDRKQDRLLPTRVRG